MLQNLNEWLDFVTTDASSRQLASGIAGIVLLPAARLAWRGTKAAGRGTVRAAKYLFTEQELSEEAARLLRRIKLETAQLAGTFLAYANQLVVDAHKKKIRVNNADITKRFLRHERSKLFAAARARYNELVKKAEDAGMAHI